DRSNEFRIAWTLFNPNGDRCSVNYGGKMIGSGGCLIRVYGSVVVGGTMRLRASIACWVRRYYIGRGKALRVG
ncbi:unnamed protein product, partial [Dovyalis caffra]